MIELPGKDHFVWLEESGTVLSAIRGFVDAAQEPIEPDRVLATSFSLTLLIRLSVPRPLVTCSGGRSSMRISRWLAAKFDGSVVER
jgi:hypothetical protein